MSRDISKAVLVDFSLASFSLFQLQCLLPFTLLTWALKYDVENLVVYAATLLLLIFLYPEMNIGNPVQRFLIILVAGFNVPW
jgi:hypothetical protein